AAASGFTIHTVLPLPCAGPRPPLTVAPRPDLCQFRRGRQHDRPPRPPRRRAAPLPAARRPHHRPRRPPRPRPRPPPAAGPEARRLAVGRRRPAAAAAAAV